MARWPAHRRKAVKTFRGPLRQYERHVGLSGSRPTRLADTTRQNDAWAQTTDALLNNRHITVRPTGHRRSAPLLVLMAVPWQGTLHHVHALFVGSSPD
jgi:hypothetical protein